MKKLCQGIVVDTGNKGYG